jgi:subtilisin
MSFEEFLPRQIGELGMRGWISPEQAAAAIRDGDGCGVRIAVLDSGIEIAHPDFQGRRLQEDFIVNAAGVEHLTAGNGLDVCGHGTAVAGIIWEIAPKAEISSFRVLGANLTARTAQISRAANEAISRGFEILNCSFSCAISGHLPLYKEWVDRALLSGVCVVAASHGDEPAWPAHFSSVLGVDCLSTLTGRREILHSEGRMVEFATDASWNVAWKDGSHRLITGSSFAAASLTGMVARLLSVHPLRDPLLLKALLRRVVGRCQARAILN